MKLRYFILLAIMLFVLLPSTSVNAASLKYSNYSLEIGGPGFWVFPNINDSPLVTQKCLFVYEFSGTDNSSFPAHQSTEFLPMNESRTQTQLYDLANFSTQLTNGAELTITYYHYLVDQTITIAAKEFQVTPDLLHVKYTIDNWPFHSNQSELGIHSYTSSSTFGTTEVQGSQNSWQIRNGDYNITASVVSQANATVTKSTGVLSAPIDAAYASTFIESGNITINTDSGYNKRITYDNFGIGFVAGSHTVTDMFYHVTLDPSTYQPSYLVVVLQIVSVVGLGTGGVFTYKKFRNRVRSSVPSSHSIPLSTSQQQIIRDLFQSRSVLFYYLTGNLRIKDDDIADKLQKAIPQDFYSFKFLMDPVRISMVKLLYENLKMSTVELREILHIGWNKFNTHLSALKDKEYVVSDYVFSDGERKQMITLLPYGIEQFKVLTDLLHLFLDNISDIDLGEYSEEFDESLFPEN